MFSCCVVFFFPCVVLSCAELFGAAALNLLILTAAHEKKGETFSASSAEVWGEALFAFENGSLTRNILPAKH